jgi:hypothetical protein
MVHSLEDFPRDEEDWPFREVDGYYTEEGMSDGVATDAQKRIAITLEKQNRLLERGLRIFLVSTGVRAMGSNAEEYLEGEPEGMSTGQLLSEARRLASELYEKNNRGRGAKKRKGKEDGEQVV